MVLMSLQQLSLSLKRIPAQEPQPCICLPLWGNLGGCGVLERGYEIKNPYAQKGGGYLHGRQSA